MRSPFHRSTRAGSGTSVTGTPAPASPAMPREDRYAATDTHFYFGWASHNGGWLIRRQVRATGGISDATLSTNASHNTFTSAWGNRETLNYEV